MSSSFEFEFLRKILPNLSTSTMVVVPAGDDCAGVKFDNSDRVVLLASDQIIGNIHYFQESTHPEKVGAKLLKRNLSDIAAMGGKPKYALVNLANGKESLDFLCKFMAGITEVANQYGVLIVGGDTGRFLAGSEKDASSLVASLTIVGEIAEDNLACRKNAKDGDLIFVTGELGESLVNEHHLNFEPRLAEGEFLTSNKITNCMMDISDGLLLDLKRICEMSNISAKICIADLPLRNKELDYKQINCGEDYELLFAVAPEKLEFLQANWQSDFAPIKCIGKFIKDGKVEVYDENNNILNTGNSGYEH
jgi:thiamine-monophosphate kinase